MMLITITLKAEVALRIFSVLERVPMPPLDREEEDVQELKNAIEVAFENLGGE
jgi:hypothetical protein